MGCFSWRLVLLVVITLLFVCGAMLPGELREAFSKGLSLGGVDAYAHLFFCTLIALLLGWNRVSAWRVVIIVLALGGLIELAQLWIPGRSTTWNDMGGNAAGALAGLLLVWLSRLFSKRENDG